MTELYRSRGHGDAWPTPGYCFVVAHFLRLRTCPRSKRPKADPRAQQKRSSPAAEAWGPAVNNEYLSRCFLSTAGNERQERSRRFAPFVQWRRKRGLETSREAGGSGPRLGSGRGARRHTGMLFAWPPAGSRRQPKLFNFPANFFFGISHDTHVKNTTCSFSKDSEN